MVLKRKPYLVIPKLIEQPTWGGDYILTLKGWTEKGLVRGKKIGQSYELFGNSKLSLTVTDSSDPAFIPEIGFADKPDILGELFPYREGEEYVTLSSSVRVPMPLLIKINQAAGNSFQLHVKPGTNDPRWQAKPESWYYLEGGYLTLGLAPGCDIENYKKTCVAIHERMRRLSQKIKDGERSLQEAQREAAHFIREMDPWRFVNRYEVEAETLIDLSMGGVHHSWEENRQKYPLGNVVYEVQMDVMDPVSTIRSFDQGKFKSDGSIRPLDIDDYFTHLDTAPGHNVYSYFHRERRDKRLLQTDFYNLDSLTISSPFSETVKSPFIHLFVRQGTVRVTATEGEVRLGAGHSCFMSGIDSYSLTPEGSDAVVLKTYT